MCFRPATKTAGAVLVLVGMVLGGCSDIYFDRRDEVSIVSGEAMAANRVTQMIDPWPPASGKRNIAYNGEKAQLAAECYRTGHVTTPLGATTSSVAYAQLQQRDKCSSKAQGSSTSNIGSNK
jgi:hypothetical protein